MTPTNDSKAPLVGQGCQSPFVKVAVSFRNHLHLFKGAQLYVFFAIALHANQERKAWSTIKKLVEEIGYNPDTVSKAVTALCSLVIDGQRVLLAYQSKQKKTQKQPSPDEP